jgi:cyclopropane fatty-acyl-phospholipid synthase-like methyltransferase
MDKTLQDFRSRVIELGYSYFFPRALLTAVKLDLFNRLGKSTLSARELARQTSCNPRAMELLLNALVGLKILGARRGTSQRAPTLYHNTPAGREVLLKGRRGDPTGRPYYVGDILNFHNNLWEGWGQLEESLHKGRPIKQHEMYLEDKAVTRSFIHAMHNTAMGHAELLARVLSLKDVKTLLDIGAGSGAFSIFFCKANPDLRATLLDLPKTLEVTREFVVGYHMRDRITLLPGDYKKSLPKGFDAAFLSHIIHSEGEKENLALMKKVYKCLNPGGRIMVQDFILKEDRANPPFASAFALNMLLYTDKGRTYTFGEIKGWLEKAGFESIRWPRLPLPRDISIVMAWKPISYRMSLRGAKRRSNPPERLLRSARNDSQDTSRHT